MIVGASMFAFGVSHIVNLLSEISSRSRKFRIKLDRMNQYMEQNKLPTELRVEIRDFLHQIGRKMRERASIREEEELLSDLSFGLRAKLVLAINKHTLLQMPLFQHADDRFVSDIAMRMRSVYSSVGECVVTEGELATEMYFILSGVVEVVINVDTDRETRVALLSDAHFFGEGAVMKVNERRSATVRAVTFTEMRSLERESFLEAAAGYPTILEQIDGVRQDRMEDTNKKRQSSDAKSPDVGQSSIQRRLSRSSDDWPASPSHETGAPTHEAGAEAVVHQGSEANYLRMPQPLTRSGSRENMAIQAQLQAHAGALPPLRVGGSAQADQATTDRIEVIAAGLSIALARLDDHGALLVRMTAALEQIDRGSQVRVRSSTDI